MEREIKFRGKTLNGDWVEGAYFVMQHDDERKHTHHFIIPDGTPIPKDKPVGDIQVEVRYFTVGQYIGMRDKNGEEIYEGDIVYVRMRDGSDCYCVIGFDEELLGFGIMDEYAYRSKMQGRNRNFDNGFMHRLYKDSLIFEVRGNIHDNLELIKVED